MIVLKGYALVTGAASGIGLATVLAFVRAGVDGVALFDIDKAGLDKAESACRQSKGFTEGHTKILKCVVDVSNEERVVSAIGEVVSEFGRIDYAVNNAGITLPNVTETSDLDTAGFDHTFSINSRGLFICLREEIKAMKQQGLTELAEDALERPASRGSIVNVASIAGVSSIYGTIAYTASKHAVVGMTKTAAIDHAKDQIRVNAVCPGWVETALMTGLTGYSEEAKEKFAKDSPMNRVSKPVEIADIILVLCSHLASFVTGAAWAVDGGTTAGKW